MPSDPRSPLSAVLALLWGRRPGQLIIQYTDSCNARCSQCGMSTDNPFPRSKLEPDLVRRVLRTAVDCGVVSVSLTGGEPLLYADEVFDLLGYAHDLGIRFTRTGTNGFMFRQPGSPGFEKKVARLATGLTEARVQNFWISLDSADPAVHEANRGLAGVVDGIRQALPILHAHGVYPAVNLGVNRTMGTTRIAQLTDPDVFAGQVREALRDFYAAVVALGFTTANVCYPMDMECTAEAAAYRATAATDIVGFSSAERAILFRVLAEVTAEFRAQIRIFTPLCSLDALAARRTSSERAAACRGGADFFYVAAADAKLYPCGFRGTEVLGDAADPASWKNVGATECRRCDWECFRDPSQLLDPATGLLRHPARSLRWALTDRRGARLWATDLRYYSACGYFATHRPPRPDRIARFRGRQGSRP